MEKSLTENTLVISEKLGRQTLARRIVGGLTAFGIVAAAKAAEGDAGAALGIDGAELKALILGLVAICALIGTAYLTVLVSISAFSMIRRVIKG